MFDQNAFANALQQKYGILQENADTQRLVGGAQANELNSRAATLGPLAQSAIGLQKAQGGLLGAQTQAEQERAKTIAPLASASIGLTQAQTGETQARGGYFGALTNQSQSEINRLMNPVGPYEAGNAFDQGGFKRGTSRVPGKGSGKKDTVKAKLAPGEAVLNRAAADMAGRENIDALNAAGSAQMGMGMPPAQPMAAQPTAAPGFSYGTRYVR